MHKHDDYYDTYYGDRMRNLFKNTKDSLFKEDVDEINDYIVHGECGLAYDHVCAQLNEYNIPISKESYEHKRHISSYQ